MFVRRDLSSDGFLSVPEGRIHYMRGGSGYPVMLFHPLGTSTWAWHTVMEPLGRQYLCYALDMLGHGDSDKPKDSFSIPDFARAVDHFMQVANIHRAHIIGNSVGAVLATELASTYPDRVDKLVLVGCPVWDVRTAPQRIQEAKANYDANGMPKPRTLEELKSAGTFANPRPEWVQTTNELRAKAGTSVYKIFVALAWYDIASRLPFVKASSTLVLYGERDRLIDGIDILKNNIPNARKVVMPGLGHIPQIEDPEAFISVVLPFLA